MKLINHVIRQFGTLSDKINEISKKPSDMLNQNSIVMHFLKRNQKKFGKLYTVSYTLHLNVAYLVLLS